MAIVKQTVINESNVRGLTSTTTTSVPNLIQARVISINSNNPTLINLSRLDKGVNINVDIIAKPFFPFITYVPLIGEIVFVLLGIGDRVDSLDKLDYYYLPSLNVWNNSHQNSIFSPFQVSSDRGRNTVPNLGEYFTEKSIPPAYPYEGDLIYEGRFGSSIRLGGTLDFPGNPNQYSNGISSNNPITIISNSRRLGTSRFKEDVNVDDSSLWLTSEAKIPIETKTKDVFKSYEDKPDLKNYTSPQSILSSDRVIIQGKRDHVILEGEKSVGLQTNGTFNVDSIDKSVINSPKIYLGYNATEPVVLGNKTEKWLNSLIDTIEELIFTVQYLHVNTTTIPGAPTLPNPVINAPNYSILEQSLKALRENIKDIKSNQNYSL